MGFGIVIIGSVLGFFAATYSGLALGYNALEVFGIYMAVGLTVSLAGFSIAAVPIAFRRNRTELATTDA